MVLLALIVLNYSYANILSSEGEAHRIGFRPHTFFDAGARGDRQRAIDAFIEISRFSGDRGWGLPEFHRLIATGVMPP